MIWEEKENTLCASFQFKDFKVAFDFMMDVAKVAEEHGHHPDWTNIYNVVSFRLNTHDAGGIVTQKDRKLAVAISGIHSKFN